MDWQNHASEIFDLGEGEDVEDNKTEGRENEILFGPGEFWKSEFILVA